MVGLVSASATRGDAIVAALGDGDGASGGGSMEACDVGAGLVGWAGSGRGGISSSALVSIVISLVSGAFTRRL